MKHFSFFDLVYFITRVPNTSERHECFTNDTSATQLKNPDFDNDTGENIFSHPYISFI